MGIESIEYVIGTGLFSEVVSEVQDLFGARSSPFEKKMQKARPSRTAPIFRELLPVRDERGERYA